MADDENNELKDPGPLRDKINAKIAELFDLNQRAVAVIRQQAKDFEMIASYFEVQRQRAYEIASLITELAVLVSTNTSNIIIAEFGHDEEVELFDLSDSVEINEQQEDDPNDG